MCFSFLEIVPLPKGRLGPKDFGAPYVLKYTVALRWCKHFYEKRKNKRGKMCETKFMGSQAWMLTFCVISFPLFVIVQLKQNIYLSHHYSDSELILTLVEADNHDEYQRQKKPVLRNQF